MGSNQQFSLRWNNYLRHITNAFDSLRSDEDLVDVTLSCEGKRIRAHKMLLSACSTYFRDLFKENPCQHPVIIFRSVKFEDLSALIDFMYQGEVNVLQDQLASFLTTAELLAVQGLSDGRDASGPAGDDDDEIKEIEIPDSPGTPTEPEVPVVKPTKKTVPAGAGAGNVRVSSPQTQQYPDKKPSAPYTDKKPPAQTVSAPSSSSSEPAAHPPAPKRRKWSAEKATPSPAPRNLAPSPDPIEVIPVLPNLKVEAPDYCELGDDDGSYGDSNSGPGGGPDPMAQLLDSKQDFSELYSTNSRDSSLTQSESFLASDLSQLLSKPGPSGENQSQDSLQGDGDMAQLVFLCETRLSTSPDVAAVGTQTETKGLFDNRGGGKNQSTTTPRGDTELLLAQDTTGTLVVSSDSGAGVGSLTSCPDGASSKLTYMSAQNATSTSLAPLDTVASKGQFMVGLSLSGPDCAAGELQFTAVQAGAAGEVQFTTVPAGGSRFMMSGPPTDSMLSTEGQGYVCKICGKAFRRQNSCYDHMAYHQGTTRCTVCNVMLSRKGNMKRHMRMVHGITEEPPQGSESLGNLSGVEVKMEDTT